MGAIGSKDTRRISFDNTFAFNTALAVQKSIQDEHDVLDIESITVVTVRYIYCYVQIYLKCFYVS